MSPSRIDKLAKLILPKSIRYPIRYARHRVSLVKQGIRDAFQRRWFNGIPLPPPLLRYRVQGTVSGGAIFLDNGLNCAQNVRSALCRLGREPYDFEEVLDFGCGCGRILRWFRDVPDSCRIHGCDIDARAVAWCSRHLSFGEFKVNGADPPLPYSEVCFDLVLCLSVIDHMDAPEQEKWLGELKRVSRPGAVLLVTFMGRTAQRVLTKEMRERIESEGFLFMTRMTGRFKLDGLPDSYQTAFQTKEHALDLCSRHFTVKDYLEGGLGNLEDMAILSA